MGKEKQNLVNRISLNDDLKSTIQQHRLFFDNLIELILAKFYVVPEDKKQWHPGLSKVEKALARKESRDNIKKARRERFDPANSNKTTLDLLKQNLQKEKLVEDCGDEETEVKPVMSGLEGDDRSVTYEELRQRLRRKIEELQAVRNAGSSDQAKKKNEKSEKKVEKKCKREPESDGKKSAINDASNKVEEDIEEASKELAFSHVKLGNEEKHGKKKKRKLSKFKELEKAQKLDAAKKDPEKGHIITKKHSWKAATSRAAGMKVHDNTKLLKQSLQKKKKKQQKNAEKWNERIETTEKMRAGRQQKRSENIAERTRQKKMRRIEKREKKLMRPGFEGRKQGYINEGAA